MKEKPEEIIKTTIRIPRQLSDALKHRAIDENCNFPELVRCVLEKLPQAEGGPAMRGNGRIFKRTDAAIGSVPFYLRGKEYRESTGETDEKKALRHLKNAWMKLARTRLVR